MRHGHGRREPYTAAGIKRLPCVRCGEPAHASWQICADDRLHRPLCAACDVALNEMVMRWVWGDAREADIDAYRRKVLGQMLALDRPPAAVMADLFRVARRLPGEVDPPRVMEMIADGRAQCHPLPGGSIVACLLVDGRAHVLAASGAISEILGYEPDLCRWYKERGARVMTLSGRRGWGRVLGSRGWRRAAGGALEKVL